MLQASRVCIALAALIVGCGGGAKTSAPEPVGANDAMETLLAKHAPPKRTPPPRAEPVPQRAEVSPTELSPKADMSKQLGGMRLGMTIEEFVSTCRKAQGVDLRAPGTIDWICSVVPVPLAVAGRIGIPFSGQIIGKFCGEGVTVCELMYMIDGAASHRDDQVSALVDMLSGKYGPPAMSEGHAGNDPMTQCRGGRTAHFKRTWIWGPNQSPPHPAGWARIVFNCDMRGTDQTHHLAVFYDDERGFSFRAAELRDRNQNF